MAKIYTAYTQSFYERKQTGLMPMPVIINESAGGFAPARNNLKMNTKRAESGSHHQFYISQTRGKKFLLAPVSKGLLAF